MKIFAKKKLKETAKVERSKSSRKLVEFKSETGSESCNKNKKGNLCDVFNDKVNFGVGDIWLFDEAGCCTSVY